MSDSLSYKLLKYYWLQTFFQICRPNIGKSLFNGNFLCSSKHCFRIIKILWLIIGMMSSWALILSQNYTFLYRNISFYNFISTYLLIFINETGIGFKPRIFHHESEKKYHLTLAEENRWKSLCDRRHGYVKLCGVQHISQLRHGYGNSYVICPVPSLHRAVEGSRIDAHNMECCKFLWIRFTLLKT